MLVSSYWLKTVLFWNGEQGKLQKGCLETTVLYDSMCKKGVWPVPDLLLCLGVHRASLGRGGLIFFRWIFAYVGQF